LRRTQAVAFCFAGVFLGSRSLAEEAPAASIALDGQVQSIVFAPGDKAPPVGSGDRQEHALGRGDEQGVIHGGPAIAAGPAIVLTKQFDLLLSLGAAS